jgi:hypothetical protein
MPAPTRPERSDPAPEAEPEMSQGVRRKRMQQQNKLTTEVRQSLSLLFITAVTLVASIGVGLFAGRLG